MKLVTVLSWVAFCALWSLIPPAYGEEKEQATPLAGEAFKTEVLGEPVTVRSRDRISVTAASFGLQYRHDGRSFYQILPIRSMYVWRNSDDERRRCRGPLSGAANDLPFKV